MTDRTVMIKGPFTDDEIRAIVAVIQRIELDRPDDIFGIVIDSPQTDMDIDEFMATIPINPGYERITRLTSREQHE
jgi:hypothetical protein